MKRIAKFEKVSFEQFKEDWENTFKKHEILLNSDIQEIYNKIKIPERSTKYSAGHDISIPFSVNIKPNDILKIPTGIRCKMDSDFVMLIMPRSSLGIKKGLFILNTVPVIDSDYYYADNEGHIFICIKNTNNTIMQLKAGENIVQAVFVQYGVADNKKIINDRRGGIGSTSE